MPWIYSCMDWMLMVTHAGASRVKCIIDHPISTSLHANSYNVSHQSKAGVKHLGFTVGTCWP